MCCDNLVSLTLEKEVNWNPKHLKRKRNWDRWRGEEAPRYWEHQHSLEYSDHYRHRRVEIGLAETLLNSVVEFSEGPEYKQGRPSQMLKQMGGWAVLMPTSLSGSSRVNSYSLTQLAPTNGVLMPGQMHCYAIHWLGDFRSANAPIAQLDVCGKQHITRGVSVVDHNPLPTPHTSRTPRPCHGVS